MGFVFSVREVVFILYGGNGLDLIFILYGGNGLDLIFILYRGNGLDLYIVLGIDYGMWCRWSVRCGESLGVI